MKHLATIFSEFIKQARKWDDLSYEDQKGYLSRHPGTRRKITAKPEGGKSKVDDDKKTEDSSNDVSEGMTYDEFVQKIVDKYGSEAKDWAHSRILVLDHKMQKRVDAAGRREHRAQGDLDGTAYEHAHDLNEPLEIEKEMLQHFIGHGKKDPPADLKKKIDNLNEQKKQHAEWKDKHKEELEEHKHFEGKTITWKHQGQEMSGRVIKVKMGKRGYPMAVTDTGWRIPISHIEKEKKPAKEEAVKTLVKADDLIDKTVSWKTKYRPQQFRMRNMRHPGRLLRIQKSPPPGFDLSTGTANGKVTGTQGSRVIVGTWRIPLSLIKKVDGKEFSMWQKKRSKV
jgi:hypothetical protein